MEAISGLLVGSQVCLTVMMGAFLCSNLKRNGTEKKTGRLDSEKEFQHLRRMRGIKLSEPLSEITRPEGFDEIIGQDAGLKALKAALCGPNPLHVIIYGPPGVGKTAAARAALDYAKKRGHSPFASDAPFVELDATISRFDERGIADPLIGSVHDPIYQGAGAYGTAGVPEPKPGAVTKAHGGILFIDEIGELHNAQMNKLLKVLEDRRVILTSSYYSSDNPAFPRHIHDIFKNGLPADFRMVGATTRSPEDIPPALRSRCAEVFFRGLSGGDLAQIAVNACKKAGFGCENDVPGLIARYASNGRDAVNLVQSAASLAGLDNRKIISANDTEDAAEFGGYEKKAIKTASSSSRIGVSNALGVYGGFSGSLLVIEVVSEKSRKCGEGTLKVTGIIEEEEITGRSGTLRRTSSAKSSIENVLTVLKRIYKIDPCNYNIHVNFPSTVPVDGPSAGAAAFCGIFSALTGLPIPGDIALTGEITLGGGVAPVGGITSKLDAAISAGVNTLLIPKDNFREDFLNRGIKVIPVQSAQDIVEALFGPDYNHML